VSASAPASPTEEVHHVAPRCLLRLHHEATSGDLLDGAGIQAWLEWEWEAMRWDVPAEISRGDLERLVEASAVLLEREEHRLIHGSDWRLWGRRGSLATLRSYGTSWFTVLALYGWGKVSGADPEAARPIGSAYGRRRA
jgi:hypothetical protein